MDLLHRTFENLAHAVLVVIYILTLDFFSRHRSQALQTLLRMLASLESREPARGDDAILKRLVGL
jgi:hypothetical protein